MTIKEFTKKYDIPIARVKAAMGIHKFLTVAEACLEYDEAEIASSVFHYLFNDIRTLIGFIHDDKEQMDQVGKMAPVKNNK